MSVVCGGIYGGIMTSSCNRNGGTVQLCPNIRQCIQCIYLYTFHYTYQLYHIHGVPQSIIPFMDTLNPYTSYHQYILVASTKVYYHCNTPLKLFRRHYYSYNYARVTLVLEYT